MRRFRSLRRFNGLMAAVHAAQGIVILVLATAFTLPLTVGFLDFDSATQALIPARETILEVPLAYLVVAFLGMSSVAHLVIATVWRRGYERDLRKGMNRARWIEYAFSAGTMMVAIAMLVGIYDLGTLVALFGLVAVMNLLGLVMEVHNQTTRRTNWLSFWVGCIAGIVPWIIVALAFVAADSFGGGEIPTFVYWIYGTIFLFFNCFALNMWLQYKKIGPWREYLYGERAYIMLSLVAKSALAWQVFAGTLRPV